MSDASRIGQGGTIGPLRPVKPFHQDAPQPGALYANVHYKGGPPQEIIKKIIQAAKRQTEERREDEGRRGKRQRPPEPDEDDVVAIASPVPESMAQPRANGCAASCIAMLLRKYGLVDSVRAGYARVEALRESKGGGILNDVGMSLDDLTKTAQELNLRARIQRGANFISQLQGVLEAINRGATPILSIQRPGMGDQRHAVLAIGATNRHVTILDPGEGEIVDFDFKTFKQIWMKEAIARGSVNEGLAYIEIWGPKPQGELISSPDWSMILEEFLRDRLNLSQGYLQRGMTPEAVLIHFFEEDVPKPDA